MASTTTAKRFHHDLRSLADGYGVLCLINQNTQQCDHKRGFSALL